MGPGESPYEVRKTLAELPRSEMVNHTIPNCQFVIFCRREEFSFSTFAFRR